MKPSNKFWSLVMILIILTIISSSFVEAGVFDSVKGFFGNVKSGAVNTWGKADDYILSKVFWINLGLIFAALFLFVQFSEQISSRFKGKEWIMYLLLIALTIFIAVKLGLDDDDLIYKSTYIKWLLHPKIIVNIVVVYLALSVITALFPIFENLDKQAGQGKLPLKFLVILIITLFLVYKAADVNPTTGEIGNKDYIWNTKQFGKIERLAFGCRQGVAQSPPGAECNTGGKFGRWTGLWRDRQNQQRVGVLHWKPQAILGARPQLQAGQLNPLRVLGQPINLPRQMPPILILIISWLLIRSILGWLLGPTGINKDIQNIFYIYLAVMMTSQVTRLDSLVIFMRFALLFVFIRLFAGIGLSAISTYASAWVVSGLIIRMVFVPGAGFGAAQMQWLWAVLGYEIMIQMMPFLISLLNAYLQFIGTLMSGGDWASRLIGTAVGLTLIGTLAGLAWNYAGDALRRALQQFTTLATQLTGQIFRGVLAIPAIKNQETGEGGLGGISGGLGSITGGIGAAGTMLGLGFSALIIYIVKLIARYFGELFTFNTVMFIGGAIVAAILGHRLWTGKLSGMFNKKYSQALERDTAKSKKDVEELKKEDKETKTEYNTELLEMMSRMQQSAKSKTVTVAIEEITPLKIEPEMKENLLRSRLSLPQKEFQPAEEYPQQAMRGNLRLIRGGRVGSDIRAKRLKQPEPVREPVRLRKAS